MREYPTVYSDRVLYVLDIIFFPNLSYLGGFIIYQECFQAFKCNISYECHINFKNKYYYVHFID